MKGKTHDLNHDLTFSAHTINCVCNSIRSMFRVLCIYIYTFAHIIFSVKNVSLCDFYLNNDFGPMWFKMKLKWCSAMWCLLHILNFGRVDICKNDFFMTHNIPNPQTEVQWSFYSERRFMGHTVILQYLNIQQAASRSTYVLLCIQKIKHLEVLQIETCH